MTTTLRRRLALFGTGYLLWAISSLHATAAIIDFDSFAVGRDNVRPSSPYSEDGYVLTSSSSGTASTAFRIFGSDDPGYTGTKAFSLGWQGPVYSLADASGEPFNLISLDLWEWRNQPVFLSTYRATVTFRGFRGDSQVVSQTIQGNGIWDSETFAFPTFRGLTRVDWDVRPGFSALHQFDNLVVTSVPEPTTAWLTVVAIAFAYRRLSTCRAGVDVIGS